MWVRVPRPDGGYHQCCVALDELPGGRAQGYSRAMSRAMVSAITSLELVAEAVPPPA
jgi:uncharacterized protein YbjQ (UPF0145 family)